MTATMTKLSSIARLAGVACLVCFVGAAKPASKKVDYSVAASTPRTIKPVMAPRAAVSTSAELLQDAQPAAATLAPSAPIAPAIPALKRLRTVRMEVTAYCPCKKCCGPAAQGVTASGLDVSYNNSRFVAADTDRLPFGTKLIIPGYDAAPVEVIDKGGAIKGHKLDVYFPTHQEALQWGRQTINVTIVE
jgi:3D (Asp-Asp-Asp) domain-containing protein